MVRASMNGSTSPPSVLDAARGSSPPEGGLGSPTRQRGFYSEVLDKEYEEVEVLLSAAQLGATSPEKQPRYAAPKQPAMRATQLKSLYGAERKEQLAAKAAAVSSPSKALEPKVLVPFKPAPGEVPRRIVIERQKRLFALQDLAELLAEVGIDSTVPDPPNALPLSGVLE